MSQHFKFTHDQLIASGNKTLTELNSGRIDLQIAIDTLVLAFVRNHPLVSIDLPIT